MRFTPDNRLIDLMVGQLFYKSPDAAMRELLQNAEDGCALRQIVDPDYEPKITVRYSGLQNWVEVCDNGLGMNREAIDRSFAAVGASKDNVGHIHDLLSRAGDGGQQIGTFGIGVLSYFGVAESLIVRTKMDNQQGLSFRVVDYHEDFQDEPGTPTGRGTTVRLNLKMNGPMRADQVPQAVERYARHAGHVELENADTGERGALEQHWNGELLRGAMRVEGPGIRSGYLALDPAWDEAGSAVKSGLVVCNGGFLVRERETDLLPSQAIGYSGEIDVLPGGLTIQLNREGFVHDEKWADLGKRLTSVYNALVRARIGEWDTDEGSPSSAEKSMERGVLLLSRGPTRGILEPDVLQRLDSLVPHAVHVKVRGETQTISMRVALARSLQRGVMYFTREGVGPQQFQHSLSEGAGTVQVTERAQTEDLRAAHLLAKGALVLSCRQRNYTYEAASGSQTFGIHDTDLIGQECQRAGIRFVEVQAASAEEVALTGAAESALLSDLLGLGEQLRLVTLDGFSERVLRDFTGRLLNTRNPEIREILRYLPEAVGNPVRRALLQIYMDLQSFRLTEARVRAKDLLTMHDLSEQAQLETGAYLRRYLRAMLESILAEPPERA